MSSFELSARLTEALAWPVVVLISVVLLREPLSGLLSRPLRSMKVGPVEAQWETAKEIVRDSLRTPPTGVGVPGREVSTEYAPDAQVSPEVAMREAHGVLENDLRQLLADNGIERADQGVVQMAGEAVQEGLISALTARSIEGLSILRNLAAQGAHRVTSAEAQEYLAMVDGARYSIRIDAARAHTGAGFGDGTGSGGGTLSARGTATGTGVGG